MISQKFQVDSAEVQSAILSEDQHNQLKIAYNLIVDNKRFADANAMYRWVTGRQCQEYHR